VSDKTAYYACLGCGDTCSYPADMLGVTKDGDVWCWDCPDGMFERDDPERPILEKFVPPLQQRIDELAAENLWLKDAANHHPDCNYWSWDWRFSWAPTDCTCEKVGAALKGDNSGG
jgi:hypothetical protein